MLTDIQKKNFDTLLKAVKDGNLVLVECTDTRDNKQVAVACAKSWDETINMFILVPFCQFFDGNPYEHLIPPGTEPENANGT